MNPERPTTTDLDPKRCTHIREDGTQCRGMRTSNGLCAGHARRGLGASREAAKAASDLGHAARAERIEKVRQQKMTATQRYRAAVERHATAFIAIRLQIARDESAPAAARLQAMQALEDRALGRAVQPTEDLTPHVPSTVEELRKMSAEERRQLLKELEARAGGSLLRMV